MIEFGTKFPLLRSRALQALNDQWRKLFESA